MKSSTRPVLGICLVSALSLLLPGVASMAMPVEGSESDLSSSVAHETSHPSALFAMLYNPAIHGREAPAPAPTAAPAVPNLRKRVANDENTCAWAYYNDDPLDDVYPLTCGDEDSICTESGGIRGCCRSRGCSTVTFATRCLDYTRCPSGTVGPTYCCDDVEFPYCATNLVSDGPSQEVFTMWNCQRSSTSLIAVLPGTSPVAITTTPTSTPTTTPTPISSPVTTSPIPTPTPEPKKDAPVGAIVGGVVGGVAAIGIAVVAAIFLIKRKNGKKDAPDSTSLGNNGSTARQATFVGDKPADGAAPQRADTMPQTAQNVFSSASAGHVQPQQMQPGQPQMGQLSQSTAYQPALNAAYAAQPPQQGYYNPAQPVPGGLGLSQPQQGLYPTSPTSPYPSQSPPPNYSGGSSPGPFAAAEGTDNKTSPQPGSAVPMAEFVVSPDVTGTTNPMNTATNPALAGGVSPGGAPVQGGAAVEVEANNPRGIHGGNRASELM